VVFQTNPETETVSRGPATLRDEYFRLMGVQSRRILERLNNARASGRNVERCCPVGLRYLSYCITSKKVTLKREPPLIVVTGELAATHTEKKTPDGICSHTTYRITIITGDVRLVRYAALSPASPATGINCRPGRTTSSV
jgi:hypothetical protein